MYRPNICLHIENSGRQMTTTTIVNATSGCNLPSIPHLQILEFAIPAEVDKVLIVEKESVFQVLKSQSSNLKDSSLIITSKGYPDVPTRDFIATLTKKVAKYDLIFSLSQMETLMELKLLMFT